MRVKLGMILVLVTISNCQTMTTINHKTRNLPKKTPQTLARAAADTPIPKDDSLKHIATDLHKLATDMVDHKDDLSKLASNDQNLLKTLSELSTAQITAAIQQQGPKLAEQILDQSGSCTISTGAAASTATTPAAEDPEAKSGVSAAAPSNALSLSDSKTGANCSLTTFDGDFIRGLSPPVTPSPVKSDSKIGEGIGIGILVGAASAGIALSGFIAYKVYQKRKAAAGAAGGGATAELIPDGLEESVRRTQALMARTGSSLEPMPPPSDRSATVVADRMDEAFRQRVGLVSRVVADGSPARGPSPRDPSTRGPAAGFDPVVKPPSEFMDSRVNILDETGRIIGYQEPIRTIEDGLSKYSFPDGSSHLILNDGRRILPQNGQFHLPDGPVIELHGDQAFRRTARAVTPSRVRLRLADSDSTQPTSDLTASFRAFEIRWLILYGQAVNEKYGTPTKATK